jgi:uncharacterized protein YcbK (DUF882 family)
MQITTNFFEYELKCPCCGGLQYDLHFIKLLQIIRTVADVPFTITSGYRCRIHNDSLENSVKDSRHLVGAAVDIDTSLWSGELKWLVVYWAMRLGLSVGHYKGYLHIDKRDNKPVLFP